MQMMLTRAKAKEYTTEIRENNINKDLNSKRFTYIEKIFIGIINEISNQYDYSEKNNRDLLEELQELSQKITYYIRQCPQLKTLYSDDISKASALVHDVEDKVGADSKADQVLFHDNVINAYNETESTRNFIGRTRGKDESFLKNAERVSEQLIDKNYKRDAIRDHWKGKRENGNTGGIEPFIAKRDSRAWTNEQKISNRELGNSLTSSPIGPGAGWRAEISHAVAGSNYGPNDELSAHPASVHQNTEWLAIESGVKDLIKKKGNVDKDLNDLRIKVTNYVDPKNGYLKSARYKIFINGKKKFDHISLGKREDISKKEANFIAQQVSKLPVSNFHGNNSSRTRTPMGHENLGKDIPAPSKADVSAGRKDSRKNPMFTDIKLPDKTIVSNKDEALSVMKNPYKKTSMKAS